jgi:glycosyltransferase involved in cell wall biosynthesis
MSRVVVRTYKNVYEAPCRYLCDELGFEVINITEGEGKSIKSGTAHFKDGLKSIGKLHQHRGVLRKADIVLSIGNFNTLWILFVNKIHLIRPGRIMWWAFFIHSSKVMKALRFILKLLNSSNVRFVVFSECEREKYCRDLGLKREAIEYIPYGNWSGEEGNCNVESGGKDNTKEYYFSGGYSNRDYISLIRAWERNHRDKQLVIIASKNNRELLGYDNKFDNIRILFDVTSEEFDSWLKGAIACILPFKENTGAAGQSVMLRCMRLGKIVISRNTDIMKEYVDNSAFLIDNYDADLNNAIKAIDSGKCTEEMLQRQCVLYENKFSYSNITMRLGDIVARV